MLTDCILVARAQVDTTDAAGATPLHGAASAAAAHVMLAANAAVDVRNNAGETALVAATERGDVDIVCTLLRAGAAIDHQDDCGKTALIRACSRCVLCDQYALLFEEGRLSQQGDAKHCDIMLTAPMVPGSKFFPKSHVVMLAQADAAGAAAINQKCIPARDHG